MDEQSKQMLDAILNKQVASLTEDDKQFLVARRDELSKDELEEFGDVIQETLARNLAKDGEPEAPARAARPRRGSSADSSDSANAQP